MVGYLDSYFILYNISPETTNKINTTQGDNKFTNNQHYHYLQQNTMSNPSENEEEPPPPPPAEAEVVDEMETITASVEDVSLSENTPDEQPPSETKTPTKEFESTPFQPTCDPARTVCPKDSRLRGPEGARGEGNNLSQAKTAKTRQGGVRCVARKRAKAEVPAQEPQ